MEYVASLNDLFTPAHQPSSLSPFNFLNRDSKSTTAYPRFMNVLDGTAEYLSSVKNPLQSSPKICVMFATTRFEEV
ncbi:hypothetical protein HK096_009210, partial [Nowakowskiella sp. JEL0078]